MPDLGALALNLVYSFGAGLVVLLVAFAVGVATGTHKVVDVAWGLAFAAIAVTTAVASAGDGDPTRRWLITTLVVVWGVRLAAHIAWRGRGSGEDPRYEKLLAKAPGNPNLYALRMVYLLQAVLAWFISWPVQSGQYDPDPFPWWIVVPGVGLWVVGFVFEAVGDWQLVRFKSDPANKGKVLDSGLWRYTRHPNYFGDACVWWGLAILAQGSWIALATLPSVALMTWFLAAKTGKPLLEEHLSRSRPGYKEYVERTSGFFPMRPS